MDTWIRSEQRNYPLMPKSFYWKMMKKDIDNLYSSFIIAVDTKDTDFIYGWMAYSPDPLAIHYIYIKKVYRKMGIASHLLSLLNLNRDTEEILCTTIPFFPSNLNLVMIPKDIFLQRD